MFCYCVFIILIRFDFCLSCVCLVFFIVLLSCCLSCVSCVCLVFCLCCVCVLPCFSCVRLAFFVCAVLKCLILCFWLPCVFIVLCFRFVCSCEVFVFVSRSSFVAIVLFYDMLLWLSCAFVYVDLAFLDCVCPGVCLVFVIVTLYVFL